MVERISQGRISSDMLHTNTQTCAFDVSQTITILFFIKCCFTCQCMHGFKCHIRDSLQKSQAGCSKQET